MNDFCANFYELWHLYYLGDFSKYMYDAGLYPEVFYLMLGFVIVPLVLYYIVIDHIQLARRSKWLLLVTLLSFLNAVVGSVVAENGVNDYLIKMNIHNTTIAGSDSVSFGLINFAWSMVLSLVFSLLLQRGSVKSRRIPF
jgi:hypothetical protein